MGSSFDGVSVSAVAVGSFVFGAMLLTIEDVTLAGSISG